MSCLEKRHVSHKASMQHLSFLDSFMDETDREVMSLTDRAFKSLCIGDEAIYNDSEFALSPVDCHKPLAEEIPKKLREKSSLDVKKHGAHPPNGMNKNSSKVSSLFAAFAAEKHDTKMTNGDSWDKSALLSIQRELSEFSSDYQNHLADKHLYQVKNHLKSSEKGTANKSSQDMSNSSNKSSKNKHSKSSKLRKLNSKNFFLHSEFSPFQSWGDLNKFGLKNIEIFPCNSPDELYDSPLYTELNNSNGLPVPESNKGETGQNPSPLEPYHIPKPEVSQCTLQTLKSVPLDPEKHIELNFLKQPEIQIETLQPQVLLTSSGSFQRCQSDGDIYAPWRKSRSRVKGVGQPLMSSTACGRSKTGEEGAMQNKKKVRTVEEATSSSSTPFSISQLLTPVIPSRQGTGTSEILQAVLSPTALPLLETEIRPSPEIKREGYKSKASGLLFNLKDNRKRVKTMYSPPKFKGLDSADHNKLSPLIEQVVTKNILETPEISDTKTMSTVHQKANMFPTSPETADIQSSPSSRHINSSLPDDFLALSLLQSGNRGSPINPLKSKKSPLVKATYPSLTLYRKASQVELDSKTMPMDVPGSHSAVNKSAKQELGKDVPEKHGKELRRKYNLIKPVINNIDHEHTHMNHVETHRSVDTDVAEKTDAIALKEKYSPTVLKKHNTQQDALTLSGSRNQDKLITGGTGKVEQIPIKYNECLKKEPKPKHLFSSRQNNYIKSQRYVNVDDDVESENHREKLVSAGRDEPRKSEQNVDVHKDKESVQENMNEPCSDVFTIHDYMVASKNDLGICTEQRVAKNDTLSMKGNTSAKIALFALKEQVPTNTVPGLKKIKIVRDNYELATVALEEFIAEREQRKKQSDRPGGQNLAMKGDYKEVSIVASSQKDTSGSVTTHRRGKKAISDFKPTCQNVQSMSDIDTKHGECHVAEVKLAEPCKQEGAANLSPNVTGLIYTERGRSDRHGQQSDTGNIQSMAKVNELKETECVPKNISLDNESSMVPNCPDNKLTRQGEDESSIPKMSSSYKPAAPPRRGRANSQSEDRAGYERERKEDVGGVDRSVKNEEFMSPEVKKVKPNLPNYKGLVRGHVSALKEKLDREQVAPSLNSHEYLSQGEVPKDYPENDLIKQKAILLNDTVSFPEVEDALTKQSHKARGIDPDNKDLPDKYSKLGMRNGESVARESVDKPDIQTVNKDVTTKEEDKKDVNKTENEGASDVLRKPGNQNKAQCHGKSSVKDFLIGLFGKSDEEKVKPDDESEKPPTSELVKPDNTLMDSITIYDILNQAEPSSLVDVKQLEQANLLSKLPEESSFSHKTQESPSLSKGEGRKCEGNLDTMDNCSISNPESKPHNSDMAVSPPSDVDKGGWVHCLIDSARNLTPSCQSNASSPTLGKPALFKVKDNTFTVSPVNKTVRSILHKTVPGTTHPWSPRESISGSEKGEEDLFMDFVEVQSPAVPFPTLPSTPVRITQPNQSSMQVISPAASQYTTDREKKGLMDSSTAPEEEEIEGVESYEASTGRTVEELVFSTALTDSIEGSMAPSERSESACSGIENLFQGKPPAVPPKTEKALRRAMKLTTKRIQKAEAKGKSERGRSSEKAACHKHERRHHSSDKVMGDRSYHRENRIDSNQSTGENSSETHLPKSHTSERPVRQHNKPESHRREKVASRKLEDGCHSRLICNDGDAKNCIAEKQNEDQLEHKDQFGVQNVNVDCERLGRTSGKYLPDKRYRRAHSLDRFFNGKHEHGLLSSEDPVSKTNSETLEKPSTAQKAPLRQNSFEHAYGSTATNIVPQSFPMTQRKLLQDPDSGQYFVVDMPVQVKTKTFFDPETGSYVQLPVQSLEGSVPRAQSMEVVNAPPLVLYHGFVPVPVSSLPQQKSSVKAGSVLTPGYLDVCESSEVEEHGDAYQKHIRERQPYTGPVHVSKEHLTEGEFDCVRFE